MTRKSDLGTGDDGLGGDRDRDGDADGDVDVDEDADSEEDEEEQSDDCWEDPGLLDRQGRRCLILSVLLVISTVLFRGDKGGLICMGYRIGL